MPSEKRKAGRPLGRRDSQPRRARVARGETKGTPNVPEHVKGNGMRGAWQRGYEAAKAGHRASDNPYPHGKEGEPVTFVRGMHYMWYEGWMGFVREKAGVEPWQPAPGAT